MNDTKNTPIKQNTPGLFGSVNELATPPGKNSGTVCVNKINSTPIKVTSFGSNDGRTESNRSSTSSW